VPAPGPSAIVVMDVHERRLPGRTTSEPRRCDGQSSNHTDGGSMRTPHRSATASMMPRPYPLVDHGSGISTTDGRSGTALRCMTATLNRSSVRSRRGDGMRTVDVPWRTALVTTSLRASSARASHSDPARSSSTRENPSGPGRCQGVGREDPVHLCHRERLPRLPVPTPLRGEACRSSPSETFWAYVRLRVWRRAQYTRRRGRRRTRTVRRGPPAGRRKRDASTINRIRTPTPIATHTHTLIWSTRLPSAVAISSGRGRPPLPSGRATRPSPRVHIGVFRRAPSARLRIAQKTVVQSSLMLAIVHPSVPAISSACSAPVV
jgi:hypothetical protein